MEQDSNQRKKKRKKKMIRVDGAIKITQNADGTDLVKCSLVADTSAEVIAIGDNGSTVEGLDANTKIAPFSTAFTKSCDLGVLGSDGVWNF